MKKPPPDPGPEGGLSNYDNICKFFGNEPSCLLKNAFSVIA
jgi:hypothetical protein